VPRGVTAVQAAAHHLLDLGGKHLRPMCVALAAKCGAGFGPTARQLAIAVELVHTATLLHDDVVDVADTRRGQPAARTIYGNATSIFAGDWLLVEALRRVRGAGDLGLLDEMLAIIEEMILAESIQLERRGQIDGDVADYYRVAEGKTAALFRWAMRAGARAGGCDDAAVAALEAFGRGLGVGFQIIDDCLDFGGVAEITGKSLYTDLREGKLTLPLLLALPRDRELVGLVAAAIADDSGAAGPANHAAIASGSRPPAAWPRPGARPSGGSPPRSTPWRSCPTAPARPRSSPWPRPPRPGTSDVRPSSRIAGFYREPVAERLRRLTGAASDASLAWLAAGGGLDLTTADRMSENVIATVGLPLAVGLNLRLNATDYLVPMATEEPSVVAAASAAARLVRLGGGFVGDADPSIMTAQIHVDGAAAVGRRAGGDRRASPPSCARLGDAAIPRMVARGGGCRAAAGLRVLDAATRARSSSRSTSTSATRWAPTWSTPSPRRSRRG
jgi:octaprenyl-diphosphate synthase